MSNTPYDLGLRQPLVFEAPLDVSSIMELTRFVLDAELHHKQTLAMVGNLFAITTEQGPGKKRKLNNGPVIGQFVLNLAGSPSTSIMSIPSYDLEADGEFGFMQRLRLYKKYEHLTPPIFTKSHLSVSRDPESEQILATVVLGPISAE